MRTVQDALVQGIALVSLVIVVSSLERFGRVSSSHLSIPFSVLFATLGMGQFHISANLMSLGGLAIAIGMMVDGTIVLTENVDRLLRERGNEAPPEKNSSCRPALRLHGQSPLRFPSSSSSFCRSSRFEGVEGKTFRPLAYTVALAMGGSLIFALALAPLLSFTVMRPPKSGQRSAAGLAKTSHSHLPAGCSPSSCETALRSPYR